MHMLDRLGNAMQVIIAVQVLVLSPAADTPLVEPHPCFWARGLANAKIDCDSKGPV